MCIRDSVSLLASTMYFQWPSQAFILRITALKSKDPSAARLARIGADVYEHFDAFRVVDGELAYFAAPGSRLKGISCTKNPSERRSGRIRFDEIIENRNSVLVMLGRIQEYFESNKKVSVSAMLAVMGKSSIYGNVPNYKNVRCCRILAEAARKKFNDCSEDFDVFQRMSPHLRQALKSHGICDFTTAMKFVKGMQEITGLPGYCLNDFIIFTCLLDDVVFDG